jgi:16S rRNA (cytosine967-C5)-methyltransferase
VLTLAARAPGGRRGENSRWWRATRQRAPELSVTVASARTLAAAVLVRVLKDRAYASAALDAELARVPQIDPRDRSLATELTYGALRARLGLLGLLEPLAEEGLKRTDVQVLAHLLVGAYQIIFLERVPVFAAVDEAVRAVKQARGARVSGFVNALLRRLAARVDGEQRQVALTQVMDNALPRWLERRLRASVGEAETRAALWGPPPQNALCVLDATQRDVWLAQLGVRDGFAGIRAGAWSAHALVLPPSAPLRAIEGELSEAGIHVQEEGSQVVALTLDVQPGHRVLDACAGRGNKSALLAHLAEGPIDVCDLHPAKLDALAARRIPVGRAEACDLSLGVGTLVGPYDRILVDAPCSGSGTLARRPDILVHRTPESVATLAQTQAQILRNVAPLLAPGGLLVYAVCSVLRAEAEEVLAEVSDVLTLARADDATFRLLRTTHGTDGYFVARLRRP